MQRRADGVKRCACAADVSIASHHGLRRNSDSGASGEGQEGPADKPEMKREGELTGYGRLGSHLLAFSRNVSGFHG